MKKITVEPIKVILIIAQGFLVAYMFTKWNWALWSSLIIGLSGSLSSYLSQRITFLWMKLANLLGFIVPNILLTLIFYLFLFPIALFSRIFSKNKNNLSLKNNTVSLFKESRKVFDKASFEKPW